MKEKMGIKNIDKGDWFWEVEVVFYIEIDRSRDGKNIRFR